MTRTTGSTRPTRTAEVRELREKVRELEASSLRTRAEFDRLWARVAEMKAGGERVRAELAELRASMDELDARITAAHVRWARTRRVYTGLLVLAWAAAGASLALTLW